MKAFMDKDFLLETETAKKLFHDYAEKTPILDYHCHINPKEIAEDRQFDNITQVWLGGDHYKWRFMRSCGVDEKYITGDASDYEKFCKWAECLGKAIGNPLFHWSHLELQRYFGYNGVLNKNTADEVWNLCNEKLHQPSMSVRNLIKQSNVTLICTTDDPIDSLEWHKKLAADDSFDVKVLPAWRPDKAMNIEKPDYLDYLEKLAAAAGMTEINSFASLKEALKNRMAFFASMGCNVSDHALEYVMYYPASDDELEEIFLKRLNKMVLTKEEELKFKTAFMLFVGKEYHKLDWAMQLHYGCKRDNNTLMFEKLGPDTGYDCINNYAPSAQMADFLNALIVTDELPRTVIYSLNPNDNQAIGTIRIDLAQYREMEVFTQFSSDLDEATKAQLAYGKRLMELLKQPLGRPLSMAEQVITLCTATHKVMVSVDVKQIKKFQMDMLAWFEDKHPEIGNEITEKKVLSDELAERIVEAAKEFKEAVWQTQERSKTE